MKCEEEEDQEVSSSRRTQEQKVYGFEGLKFRLGISRWRAPSNIGTWANLNSY